MHQAIKANKESQAINMRKQGTHHFMNHIIKRITIRGEAPAGCKHAHPLHYAPFPSKDGTHTRLCFETWRSESTMTSAEMRRGRVNHNSQRFS